MVSLQARTAFATKILKKRRLLPRCCFAMQHAPQAHSVLQSLSMCAVRQATLFASKLLGRCPSGLWGRIVNPLTHVNAGSNPARPKTSNQHLWPCWASQGTLEVARGNGAPSTPGGCTFGIRWHCCAWACCLPMRSNAIESPPPQSLVSQ